MGERIRRMSARLHKIGGSRVIGSCPLPIRIYALAKELKIDNKILVDICTKAGITGKGSALASLSDEEVVKLKTFMNEGRGGKSSTATLPRRGEGASTGVLRREDYIAPAGAQGGKIPVLPAKLDKPPLLKKRAPEKPEFPSEEIESPVVPVEEPKSPRDEPAVEAATSTELPPTTAPMTPETKKLEESVPPAPFQRPEMKRPEVPLRPSRPPLKNREVDWNLTSAGMTAPGRRTWRRC
jgi:translation initiation factor IF-2